MNRSRRRVTVDTANSVSEDTEKRKPSVFERLGPGGGRAKHEAALSQDHGDRPRFLKKRKGPSGGGGGHLHDAPHSQATREDSPPEDLRLRVKKNQAAHRVEASSSDVPSPDARKNLHQGRDKIKSTIVVKKSGQDSDEMEDDLDRANPGMQDLEKQRLQIQQELDLLGNPEVSDPLPEASPNMSPASSPDVLRSKKGSGKKKGDKKKKRRSPGAVAPLSPASSKAKGQRSPSPGEVQRPKEQKKRVEVGEEEHHRGGKHKKKKHEKRHQLEPERAAELDTSTHSKHKLSPYPDQQPEQQKHKDSFPPEFASPVSKGSHRSRSSPEPMESHTPVPRSRSPSPLADPGLSGHESPPPRHSSKERQKEKVKSKKKKDKSKKKMEASPVARVEEPFMGELATLEDYKQIVKNTLEEEGHREERRKSGSRKRKRSLSPGRRSVTHSPSPSSHHKQSLSPEPQGKMRHKHSSKERQRRMSSERRRSRDRHPKKRHKRSASPHHADRPRDRESPRESRHAPVASADKSRRGPGDAHQAADSRRRHSPSPRRHSPPPHSRSRPSPEPARRSGHPDDKPDPRHRHGQSPDDRDPQSLRDSGSRRLDVEPSRARDLGDLPRDRSGRYQDASRGDQRDRGRYEGYPDRPPPRMDLDSDRYPADRAGDRQDLEFGRDRRAQDRDRFPKDGRHGDGRDQSRDWGHRQGRSDPRSGGPPDDLRGRPPGRGEGRGDRYDDRGMMERSSRRSEWEAQQHPPDTHAWDEHRGDRGDFPPRREGYDPQRQGSTPPEERGSRHDDRRVPDLRGDHPDHRGEGRDDRMDRRGDERGERRDDRARDDRRRTGRSFSPPDRDSGRPEEKGRPASREDRVPRDESRGRRDDRPARDDRDRPVREDRHGRDPRDDRHARDDHGSRDERGREDRGRDDVARKDELARDDKAPRDAKRVRDERGDDRGGREERGKDDRSSQGSREDRLNRDERGDREDRGPRAGNQEIRRNRDSHSPAPRADRLPPKDRGDRSYSEERGNRDRRSGGRRERPPERGRHEAPGAPRRGREDASRGQAEDPPPEMFRFGRGKGPLILARPAPEAVPLAEEWGLRRAQASQGPRGGSVRDGHSPAGSERRSLGEGRSPPRDSSRDSRQFPPLSPSHSQSSGSRQRGLPREEMDRMEERRERDRPPPLLPELDRRMAERLGHDREPLVDERGDRFMGHPDMGGGRGGDREDDLSHTASPRRLTDEDRRAGSSRGGSPPLKRGRESSPAGSQHSHGSMSMTAGRRGARNVRTGRGGRSRNLPPKQLPRGQLPPGDRKRVEEIRDPSGPRPLLELNLTPTESARHMEREMSRDRPMNRHHRLSDRGGMMRGHEGLMDHPDDRIPDRGEDWGMDRPPERPQDQPREQSLDRGSERSMERVSERGGERHPEQAPDRGRPTDWEPERGRKRKHSPAKDEVEDSTAKRQHLGPEDPEAAEGEGLPVAKEKESVGGEGMVELSPPHAPPSLPPPSTDAGGDEGAFSDWSDDDEQANILMAEEEERPTPQAVQVMPQETAAASQESTPSVPAETVPQVMEPAKNDSGAVANKQDTSEMKADEKTDNSLAEEDPEYEQISSDEDDFTEETDKNKKSIVDILDLDWSSLSQQRRPATEGVSTLQRFQPGAIFSKLGVSRAFAGETLYQKVKDVCREFAEANKKDGGAVDGTAEDSTAGKVPNGKAEEGEAREKEEKEAPQETTDIFLHDVASLHAVAWERRRARRQLLSNLGPNRRALCARVDLDIRRQLCKVNQVYEPAGTFPNHLMDASLCKLSIQLFRQDRSLDSEMGSQN